MDLRNSGFSTLYQHNKDLDDAAVEHMRLKYDIFLNCLNAKEWKAVKNQCVGDIFVHPKYAPPDHHDYADYDNQAAATDDDGFDFENSIEGVAFVQPFNFGHEKSGKTLDHYNELYAREVLGTEIGRRLIQQHLPPSASSLTTTPMEVDQVQVDNRKKLENDNFNYLMKSLKGLSIGGGTNLRQIDDALSVSKSVGERLELLRNRHLEMEKNKRQLELVSQNELVLSEKKRRTDANQVPSTSTIPMEEDIDDDGEDRPSVYSQAQLEKDRAARKESLQKMYRLLANVSQVPPSSTNNAPGGCVGVEESERDKVVKGTFRPQPNVSAADNNTSAPQKQFQKTPQKRNNINNNMNQQSNMNKSRGAATAAKSNPLTTQAQEMELECESTAGNTSVKVTFTLQDGTTTATTAAAATTANQQPNPSPTNNNLSNQPLPDYELANNDELEPTFATQAEKKRHLDNLKLERLAPSLKQKESMESGDKTPNITQVIGDEYRAGYAKVTNEIKKAIANKYSQLPILGKEYTPSPEEIELESICNTTAQEIKKQCPGYIGNLLPEAELLPLVRVSKGSEGYNNGESQEVSMLAVANLLKNENRFGLPVVLHQKIMKGLGYYRHFPEKCDALMQTIKAIHYSKYKKIILMVNDTIRAFYESVHYCYFLGVVKALNPNKEIEIISCANGLVPTIGLPYIIQAIHTREMKHLATETILRRLEQREVHGQRKKIRR